MANDIFTQSQYDVEILVQVFCRVLITVQLTHRPASHKRSADSLLQGVGIQQVLPVCHKAGVRPNHGLQFKASLVHGEATYETHLTKGVLFALPAHEPSFTSSGSSQQNLRIMFLEVSGELVTGEGGKLLDWISGATRIIFWHEHTPFWILQKRKHKQKHTKTMLSLCRIAGALAFHLSFAPVIHHVCVTRCTRRGTCFSHTVQHTLYLQGPCFNLGITSNRTPS